MKPRILLVGGEKGGSGKSMLSRNLAVFAAQEGMNPCLVDADPQKTSTQWMSRRHAAGIEPNFLSVEMTTSVMPGGKIDPKGIAPRLMDLAKSYDVIVDCGGRNSAELRSSMLVADVMVTPFCPSIDDVETVSKLIELISDSEVRRGKALPVLAVTNKALKNNFNLGIKKMRETFEELGEVMSLSGNVIYQRLVHSNLSEKGMCVADDRSADAQAFAEMQFLFNEIYGID